MGTSDASDRADEPPSRHTEPPTGPPPLPALADLTAIVLAAGSGSRMRSRVPKMVQPLAGRPLVAHVLHALRDAGLTRAVVVTGQSEPEVRAAVADCLAVGAGLSLEFVSQDRPLGTGHAVEAARAAVRTTGALVVNGDLGLLSADQVRAVADVEGELALATGHSADPTGFGRIDRDASGRFRAIVEEAEATPAERAIDEINVGIYRFESAWLWQALANVQPAANGERYLTDVLAAALESGVDVRAVDVGLPDGPLNIETKRDLARAEAALRRRICERWLDEAVTIVDPSQTYIDADVCVGADTVIEPGSHLRGRTRVGARCTIGPNTILRDSQAGDGCELVNCQITGSELANDVSVGAYSTLREGTVLAAGVHVGTHAEIKAARLGEGVQMGHFSYVGDAEVGARTNIGAGAITCNFDGQAKHRTIIGADAFIGSDTLLVAPLRLGDGASTGAGAVVNRDVGAGERVVGSPARSVRRGRGTT